MKNEVIQQKKNMMFQERKKMYNIESQKSRKKMIWSEEAKIKPLQHLYILWDIDIYMYSKPEKEKSISGSRGNNCTRIKTRSRLQVTNNPDNPTLRTLNLQLNAVSLCTNLFISIQIRKLNNVLQI